MKRTKRLIITMLTLLCCCTGAWASSIPGALSGRFTINASGEKVVFSQGNLQYFCSTSAPEWRFAEHQYDYVAFDISAYAANSEKWIDLFAHGTSGYNNGQTNYQPYVVGAAANTYYQGNLTGNADWGYNAISNGGNTENIGWRTLTRDEWLYVFSGRSNAASKYGHGSINGTNGMILLPDSWTLPDGLSFTSGNSAWTNSYTLEQWSLMENAGAVFLPASGSCNSAGIPSESTQNQNGFYRASTAAYYMYFRQSVLQNCEMSFYQYGDAVRLVKDYQLQQDAEGNYLIGSADDWKLFATLVNSGTNPAANAKMTADIDLGDDQTMIGTGTQWSDYGETGILRFQGVFDGQGHTLTINYNATTEGFTAPFRHIKKATIKNLRVAGTITTNHTIAAGIASSCAGNGDNSYIINCVSSVDIISNYVNSGHPIYDGARTAGIIGQIFHNAHINISDCIFNGSISGETQQVLWGGMVGLPDGPVTITNSLQIGSFDCSDVVTGNEGSGTFSTIWNKNINITNSYYLNALGAVQGTQATSAQLVNGTTATALQNGRAEEVWVQDPVTNQPMLKMFATKAYTVPASGIGTFSAKAKFTVPNGLTAHYCKTYDKENGTIGVVDIDGVVPANTGVLLKGTPGETYTLTGTNNEAATVTDNALVAVTEATHVNQVSGDYTNFMLKSGKFIKIEASDDPNVKMPANRAYLQILTSDLPVDSQSETRGIRLSWDSVTNVPLIDNGQLIIDNYSLPAKRIINGKLIIEKNGQMFNTNGQLIK